MAVEFLINGQIKRQNELYLEKIGKKGIPRMQAYLDGTRTGLLGKLLYRLKIDWLFVPELSEINAYFKKWNYSDKGLTGLEERIKSYKKQN